MDEIQKIQVHLEVIGIDEATKKAERYVELLKEAKTLADELASADFEIGFEQVTESSSKDIIPIGDQTVKKSTELLTRSLKTL
ncbi:hypothetical protein QL848_001766 [Enterococcus faecium]|nr:hypothetical protein [Enterococcus faecium]